MDIYKEIAENSRDVIFSINSNFQITYWNTAAENTLGMSKNEALGKPFFEQIVPATYHEELRKGLANNNSGKESVIFQNILEIYLKKKTGEYIPFELQLKKISDEPESEILCFARDVRHHMETESELNKLIEEMQVSKDIIEQNASELIYLNHKLEESEQQLQELNTAKDKFFSIIAHDLRNPFQGFLGYSEFLARDIENLTKEEIIEYAGSMNESARQLFKLLENLLHWSRIQRGMIEFNPITLDLYSCASMNIDIIYLKAKQKGIKLENIIQQDLNAFADVNMFNTVMRNLVSNSVKFTPSGGTITVGANILNENFIEIFVRDTGVGMDEKALGKIFHIDSQHTTTGTDQETGTGLGLILCKDLVNKCGGEIRVESEVGKGSTFFFTLPAKGEENSEE
ncbi:MAG: response regulator receiver sensor signal transduction histidine kinase [Ignavibacteria bacterium]|nr:response regulator receiver sensor signal transduction histidine kinase [Ignavibacteria bacterium]